MRIFSGPNQYYDILFTPLEVPYVLFPSVSFILTTFAFIVCLTKKLSGKPLKKMIMFMNLSASLFYSVKFFGSTFYPEGLFVCQISDFVARFGMIATAVWGTLFAHALFRISKYKLISLQHMVKIYVAITVIIATVLTIASSMTELVQFKDNMCFYQIDQKAIDLEYLFITALPLLGCCILTLFWYARSARSILTIINEERTKYLLTLICYPIVSILCWFPLAALYFWMSVTDFKGALLAAPLEALCQVQGSFNSLIFGIALLKPFRYCFRQWDRVILSELDEKINSKPESLTSSFSDGNDHHFPTEISSIMERPISIMLSPEEAKNSSDIYIAAIHTQHELP